MQVQEQSLTAPAPFYEQPGVELDTITAGPGIPIGIEPVYHPDLGIGGAYGAWGESYDNEALPKWIESRLGEPVGDDFKMNLAELGFTGRYHTPLMEPEEDIAVEEQAGARFLKRAIQACGWDPGEVEGVLIGLSAPLTNDFVDRIARLAGIPETAIKLTVHKACDSSVSALHLSLNPDFGALGRSAVNLAQRLKGKKVLVGGIEGLSRFMRFTRDKYGHQLFGSAAGVIGVIPGKTVQFLVGRTREVFDREGQLQVKMTYPHHGHPDDPSTLVEYTQTGENSFRIAGLQHEPADGSSAIMAGPMGMVKLFVRSGVEVVRDTYQAYREMLEKAGQSQKDITVAVVHHANYKINKLKEKNLAREGIHINMPWVLSEFGNVSAASPMIAFLRLLPGMKPGDHVLIDGFGAGTYYDVVAVKVGE
jgi:3-oxoacyl-[acyl-carrier-protein] synthase III